MPILLLLLNSDGDIWHVRILPKLWKMLLNVSTLNIMLAVSAHIYFQMKQVLLYSWFAKFFFVFCFLFVLFLINGPWNFVNYHFSIYWDDHIIFFIWSLNMVTLRDVKMLNYYYYIPEILYWVKLTTSCSSPWLLNTVKLSFGFFTSIFTSEINLYPNLHNF